MHLWCSYLLILLLLVFVCVQGQNPNSNGFINIDCGIASNTSYVHGLTGLTYVSDDQYLDTGLNGKISSQYPVNKDTQKDLETVRSFPNGTKNCYTLTPVTKGSKYFVSATFYYGNYDRLETFPTFDLYLGVNFWSIVNIFRSDNWYHEEIISVAPANYIQVCLMNTGLGTPFISTLELRPFTRTLYEHANATQSLKLYRRQDVGSNDQWVRYPYDEHDRLWSSYTQSSWTAISTNSSIDGSIFEVPSLVLQTAAVTSAANSSMDISLWAPNTSIIFLLVLYMSEVEIMQNASLREFYIYLNEEQVLKDPVHMEYRQTYVFYSQREQKNYINVSFKSSARATLPPILNAFELYTILPVTLLPTDATDVSAIKSIKTSYSIRKDWNGDPCLPTNYSWTGVSCTINSSDIPRITVLNLSSSGLTGAMVSAFGYLTELETLVLSHNSLSGDIPYSLDELTSLTFLDLSENIGLSGTLPPGLLKRQKNGRLTVLFNSTDGGTRHRKSSKTVIFIIVAIVIVLVIVGAVALFFLYQKKKKNTHINPPTSHKDPGRFGTGNNSHLLDPGESGAGGLGLSLNKKQFSFVELELVTNHFREKIGIGGFGEVFKGRLENGIVVAVKVRSESSSQGTQQFLNEVEKLSRVHHKNLVSLIGYCKDRTCIALIYEYMQEGNLQDCLRGNAQPLSWKQRLRIAYESAQGLEYLHKMCNPPLIHRDVKTSNILLTRNLEAKVSDFGLVRAFSGTHVFTNVVGTPGYLDPHYASTSQLIEKSDVYSFGVVLLEIVTGKAPIRQGPEMSQHLTEIVKQRLSQGNIESILDPYMGGQYNLNSIWKVSNLALRCTDVPEKRPDITAVVTELKESLTLEMSSIETGSEASGNISEHGGNFEKEHIGDLGLPDYGPSTI